MKHYACPHSITVQRRYASAPALLDHFEPPAVVTPNVALSPVRQAGPAVVVRSTSAQLSAGVVLLTWDACGRHRAIEGLSRSGIVKIHAVHLT